MGRLKHKELPIFFHHSHRPARATLRVGLWLVIVVQLSRASHHHSLFLEILNYRLGHPDSITSFDELN